MRQQAMHTGTNSALSRLDRSTTALLVIDLQDRLLPVIHEGDAVVAQARKLLQAAAVLDLPLVVTEQYPAGLGPTCAPLRELTGHTTPIEKTRFTACVDAAVARLREFGRPHILIAGIETHICVQQTVLDLLRLDYRPFVCADATGSRRYLDRDIALERMRHAGATVTTIESAIFELLDHATGDTFKQILKIVK
jgi:nicotinamidase-related amidase